MSWFEYRPYVPVAKRRAQAAKQAAKMAKKGTPLSPVNISGRKIATTFWGEAWCKHLESYSDYENRLPRGRTYLRNGSVLDLKIEPAKVTALVMGSSLYKQTVEIHPIAGARWDKIKKACSGKIDSLVELLQGRLSASVMGIVTHRAEGMFPAPREIRMTCSCPDWADLCKHLAAVLYAVGARLDTEPELLFTLRRVDHTELIAGAASGEALTGAGETSLDTTSLAGIFGIEIDSGNPEPQAVTAAVSKTTPEKPQKKTKAPAAPKKQKKIGIVKKPAKTKVGVAGKSKGRVASKKTAKPAKPGRKRA